MRKTTALFQPITFTWWQVGLLKLSLVALGVVVGSTWPGLFVGGETCSWFCSWCRPST